MNLLNGKNIDEIEFQPGSPSKTSNYNPEDFHFGPNSGPFSTPGKPLDQSEASTKAVCGDESANADILDTSLDKSPTAPKPEPSQADEPDFHLNPNLKKEDDPMSMSFYQDKEGSDQNPFDLNKVHDLPTDLDDYLAQPNEEPVKPENLLVLETTDLDKSLEHHEVNDDLLMQPERAISPKSEPEPEAEAEPEPELLLDVKPDESDLMTSRTPEPTSGELNLCQMPQLEAPLTAKSEVLPENVCLSPVQAAGTTLTTPDLESLHEDVTSSVKDESASPILSPIEDASSPVSEPKTDDLLPDSHVEATALLEAELESCPPTLNERTDSVTTLGSFLDRSGIPDVTSPITSPEKAEGSSILFDGNADATRVGILQALLSF